MPAVMLVVCAWCTRLLGEKACAPEQAGQVTHSCCAECEARILAEIA